MSELILHQALPALRAGAQLPQASAAMVLLHGRGASAHDIMQLTQEWHAPGMAFLAPQAANGTWYPNRFVAPVATNEPWLSSALTVVGDLVQHCVAAGIPATRLLLLGFSQGGCLALEFAARQPQPYGGVIGLSAGLIENGDLPRTYAGDMAGTPVFLGCSDVDFHIPRPRVDRTAQLFAALGATVDKRIYPAMGHTINCDELAAVQALIDRSL